MSSTRFPYLFLVGSILLGALSLLLIRYADEYRAKRPVAVYTLTPSPDKGTVLVRLEMNGLEPGRVLFLGPEDEEHSSIGPPARAIATEEQTPEVGPNLWWAEVGKDGRIVMEYEVTTSRLDSRYALLIGRGVFAIPIRAEGSRDLLRQISHSRIHGVADRIELRFEMPKAWDAYTPWGQARPVIEVPQAQYGRLRGAFLALGDYVPRRFRAGGASVEMVMRRNDLIREDELERLIRDCLDAHADMVGPALHEYVLVIADHPFRGDQAAGRASVNSVFLDLSSDPEAMEYSSTLRVIAHELFHLWNGGGVNLDPDHLRWFAEGVTEYYALRALAASGRIDMGTFANELAAALDRLEGNPWADSTLTALGRGYRNDSRAWTATYSKGALTAWAVDLRLDRHGGLDRVMRSIMQRGERPDPEAVLAGVAGGRVSGLLDSLSSPQFRVALDRELAKHHLKFVQFPSGTMTLGLRFFRPGTTELLDVDPLGPAALGGLLPGDRVVAVNHREVVDLEGVAEAFADAGGGEVELVVDRAGIRQRLTVRPMPAYATRVETVPPGGLAAQVPDPGRLPR